MANQLKIIGSCYKNFGLKHTSNSQNTIPEDIRFLKYIVMTEKERAKIPSNCSFEGGKLVHEIAESALCNNKTVDEVILVNSRIKKIIDNFTPLDNKDELKFKHIIDKNNLKSISENHLKAINELPKCSWIAEQEHTLWLDPEIIFTYFLIYMDLVGTAPSGNVGEQIYIGDLKNVFGTLTKTKKGFSYSNKKAPVIPHHSHLMQISLYCECIPGSKPFISYASNCDYRLFTEDNCDELKPENRKKYVQQLKVYQLSWQKKLEIANGDIKILSQLVRPDFSEMRKTNNIWWSGINNEYRERFKKLYA